ncbi:glutamate racemase [Chimaeribacter californicus]|uniref:Glutamate racemase n=1 Tax=Chimaeribacter californicus TaxID=2060067 RepID=A0A2N5E240_9GAMM|nr:glutamate racemase [Chimaeribacter californicus]PLR34651.1 glutamate racemase [Chimaeribacter californicus]
MTVACLHTAASNIAVFDEAANSLAIAATRLSHIVMPHWLEEAEKSGGLTAEQRARLADFLRSLTPFFEAILITCSTLGPVAEDFPDGPCPVLRTDKMLTDALHRLPGKSVVLCAAPSTLAATTALFCPPGLAPEQHPEVRLIAGAWEAFKAGDHAHYLSRIAEAAQQAHQQGAENVALAQVSMTPAVRLFPPQRRPLTSPHLALQHCFGR